MFSISFGCGDGVTLYNVIMITIIILICICIDYIYDITNIILYYDIITVTHGHFHLGLKQDIVS